MKMDDFSAIFEPIFTQFFLLVRCDHTEFVEINVGQVFFTDETVNNFQVGFEQITKTFVKPKETLHNSIDKIPSNQHFHK